ncbi:MAG: antitoxin family protein [Gemmatimonadetes bacterium]|nr:antitoxin family protein [Gemmatimonadota bacterium]
MTQTFEAVFENGIFRLLEKPAVSLRDGQHVRLTVETEVTPGDVLALAEQVYAGLSDEEVDDVDQIALDRRSFFGDRTA